MDKSSNAVCTERGVKGGGPSPESQTNLHFHNYICIYIMATESWSVISDPYSLLMSIFSLQAGEKKHYPLFLTACTFKLQ